jgi:hypothetical protein
MRCPELAVARTGLPPGLKKSPFSIETVDARVPVAI